MSHSAATSLARVPQFAAELADRIVHRAHDAMFRKVHSSSLIYNTCWEDPRLDRQMLELRPDSRVVMITSAGCNALDYLLDNPAEIHAVDMNPRQNALLELKIALIENGDHSELRQVFGEGGRPGFRDLLQQISPRLSPYAREFWNQKHSYFESKGLRPSFYYRGAAGQIAWVVLQSLVKTNAQVAYLTGCLMEARSLDEQRDIYERIKPSLWNVFNSWLVKQPLTMSMLGVPRPQIDLIENSFPGGIAGYVQTKMEYVLTKLPMADNYFWRVYLTGRYTDQCCPNYLRPENMEVLGARTSRVKTHSTTIADFLERNPGTYTHFVLLDHQDWLASRDASGLRDEWDLLLRNSRPGSRILMRSASPEIDFIPAGARERLRLFPEWTAQLHQRDRVGTYGCTLLAEVL